MGDNGLSIRNIDIHSWVFRLLDATVFTLAGIVAYAYYVNIEPMPVFYKLAFGFSALLVLVLFPMFGIYTSWRGKGAFEQAYKIVLASMTVFIALILISVAMKMTYYYSRVWMGIWIALGTLSVFACRELVYLLLRSMRKRGWNLKRIVLIGSHDFNSRIQKQLRNANWTGFQVVQSFDNNIHSISSDLLKTLSDRSVHEVWVTYSLKEAHLINDLLLLTKNLPHLKFRYVPDISDFQLLLNNSVSEVAGIVTLEMNHTTVEGLNVMIKEIEDRILAFLILIFISPLLLLISVAIKIDSRGPVLYKQKRHGWGGTTINVYKFRSMTWVPPTEDKFIQATKNDSRVTRVGAFLRRTSLDELPQFFNVLQGRMSIVGPRPHAIEMNKQYMALMENYFIRNKVKPGITGWAQVNGWRGETDTLEKMEKRVEYDLYYIRNWSIWLDLKIIFLTLWRGFIGKNAY